MVFFRSKFHTMNARAKGHHTSIMKAWHLLKLYPKITHCDEFFPINLYFHT
jgi:hypothetical protein